MSRNHSFRVTRDLVLFVCGLLGIGYETLFQAAERPTLLILFAGMIGLPVFLRTDEKSTDAEKMIDAAEKNEARHGRD